MQRRVLESVCFVKVKETSFIQIQSGLQNVRSVTVKWTEAERSVYRGILTLYLLVSYGSYTLKYLELLKGMIIKYHNSTFVLIYH